MNMDKNDLQMKYIVFKIKDVEECLHSNEQEILYRFLSNIVAFRKRQKDKLKTEEKTTRLMYKQFQFEVENMKIDEIERPTDVQYRVIEMMKKYGIYVKPGRNLIK